MLTRAQIGKMEELKVLMQGLVQQQELQNQKLDAQSKAQEAQNQKLDAQSKAQEAQNQKLDAQKDELKITLEAQSKAQRDELKITLDAQSKTQEEQSLAIKEKLDSQQETIGKVREKLDSQRESLEEKLNSQNAVIRNTQETLRIGLEAQKEQIKERVIEIQESLAVIKTSQEEFRKEFENRIELRVSEVKENIVRQNKEFEQKVVQQAENFEQKLNSVQDSVSTEIERQLHEKLDRVKLTDDVIAEVDKQVQARLSQTVITDNAAEELNKHWQTVTENVTSKVANVGATINNVQESVAQVQNFVQALEGRVRGVERSRPSQEVGLPNALHSKLKPATYDGKGSWSVYKLQFEIVATANNWNDWDRACVLASSLRSPAAEILQSLPEETRLNYRALIAALDLRFGDSHLSSLHAIQLRNKRQDSRETLPELAGDIERMTKLAYPQCPEPAQDSMALQYFIDAITDADLQHAVRMADCNNLRAAVVYAMKYDSSRQTARGQRRYVRYMSTGEERNKSSVDEKLESLIELSKGTQQQLRELNRNMRCNATAERRPEVNKPSFRRRSFSPPGRGEKSGRPRMEGQRPPATDKSRRDCWRCGKPGHLERFCRNQMSERRKAEETVPKSLAPLNSQ